MLAARDLDGRPVGPAGPGQDATVVVVFASWCGPCRRELAMLDELRHETPRVRIIGVNAFEDWGDMSDQNRLRAFLAHDAPWLQVVPNDDAVLAALGRPTKIPTLFVFDRGGRLVVSYLRARRRPPDKRELRAGIDRALAAADTTAAPTPPGTEP
ncbi:TlpA family protein disulfide reductase [Haliangium sp.]|uniref:TlpA family protein disulfide reductase n=1 Tax=Haliangium sp. TaxID=2663208 RepID=UPI003D0F074A